MTGKNPKITRPRRPYNAFKERFGEPPPQGKFKEKVYKDKIMKIADDMKIAEDMDLGKMRQRVDAIGKLLSVGTMGGVAGTMGKKLKLKKDFDDGGVVDMTTEVDVE